MKTLLLPFLAMTLGMTALGGEKDGWIPLFDGKSLDGWKANENAGTFSVKDGELIVKGDRSHLFYAGPVNKADFKNFELKLEIMTKPGANSGVYFHTAYQDSGWPAKGYEIQVNNTHKDPKKTAGVYAVQDNFSAPAKDDEWFTMEIKVEGRHVVTKVNGKVISDFTEPENWTPPKGMPGRAISHGTIAIQGHDPGSEVRYKSILIKPLP
ncbi:MAG: DUF1080 domain-containing protein [Chthoniobacteraceae bacterium]